MKRILFIMLALLLVLAMIAGCSNNTSTGDSSSEDPAKAHATEAGMYDLSGQEPITIVFPIPNGANNIETIYTEKWIDLVEERSEGLISFEYTNSGALGTYEELLEGVEYGVYDMTISDVSYIQSYVPESIIMSLPFIFENYEHANAVFNGEVGEWYKKLVADKTNMKILNYYFCGFRYICSKDKIASLSDCEGVLIRSPQIDVYTDMLGLMGFSYVTMAWAEAYTAMSTGVIEAVEVPLQNIYEFGFYDLGKYICGTRHLLSINSIVANETFWDGLPSVYQDIMFDAIAEVTSEEYREIAEKEENYKDQLVNEKGCTYNEFNDEAKAELKATFSAYWHEKVEELGDEAVAILEKIAAE